MAFCLFGTKPLSEPMLPYCQLDPKEYISLKFYSKFEIFIKGNGIENVVCENENILSQPQCVNVWMPWTMTWLHIHSCNHRGNISLEIWTWSVIHDDKYPHTYKYTNRTNRKHETTVISVDDDSCSMVLISQEKLVPYPDCWCLISLHHQVISIHGFSKVG